MNYFVTVGDEEFEIALNGQNGTGSVEVNGESLRIDCQPIAGNSSVHSLILDGKSYDVWAEPQNGTYLVAVDGQTFEVRVEDERSRLVKKLGGAEGAAEGIILLKAPMPGLVVRVEVQENDRVTKGQGLVVVEAMKMENEIKAPADGTVKSIKVAPGRAIEKNAVLLEIHIE